MSITAVKGKTGKAGLYANKWDEAIAGARQKIRGLKETIEFFERKKKAHEPWPEESAT
jgi:hypothetical protein